MELSALALYITALPVHVKSRRGFPPVSLNLYGLFRQPSFVHDAQFPINLPQLRIGIVHFFVASKVDRYRAFSSAVSLGNTLRWRFSFR